MIQVKSLYKSFEGKDVLVDINATFNNGKTNLIIGQSGSGKTVLMKCIVGLLTPEKGEILYDGRNFLNMNKKEKKDIAPRNGNDFPKCCLVRLSYRTRECNVSIGYVFQRHVS